MGLLPKFAALLLAAPFLVSASAVPGAEPEFGGAVRIAPPVSAPAVPGAEPDALSGAAIDQVLLGIQYYFGGEGVPQDHAKAAHWFRKAAEQGYASGQRWLGEMYAEGKGVPQDFQEAVHWYRKAAKQGDAHGQIRLGTMYAFGQGVPKDDVQAYAWFNLAAAAGKEVATKLRDILLERMTPKQVAEGQALSRDLAAKLRE